MSSQAKRYQKTKESIHVSSDIHRKSKRNERKSRSEANDREAWFRCVHCGQEVVCQAWGTGHRNHCPYCLWSRHVDDEPGDRAADCGGAMEPVTVWARSGGDWAIIHRCRTCGELHSNRIAGDDNELALMALATRAIALTPFPLSRLRITPGGSAAPAMPSSDQ